MTVVVCVYFFLILKSSFSLKSLCWKKSSCLYNNQSSPLLFIKGTEIEFSTCLKKNKKFPTTKIKKRMVGEKNLRVGEN